MTIPSSDASIPVLTQIISTPKAGGATAKQPSATDASSTPVSSGTSGQAAQMKTDEDWKALELKLNERVLRQILRRVDFVIEHRVKESLADILQVATEELIKEIRSGLQVTLEDVITRAVAQEIARVQAINN
jgi:hypothetical protein